MKKSKILIPLLLLNSTFAIATNNTISMRVVGGQESSDGSWPWIVSVSAGGYACGGTLIDNKTVLTAAHCLFDDGKQIPSHQMSVVVGEYDLESQPATPRITVTRAYIHSDYNTNDSTSGDDIALLRLSQAVNSITPLPALDLSTTVEVISFGDDVTVIGWGSTVAYAPSETVSPRFPTILREVSLPLQTNDQCAVNLGDNYDPKTMLCAAPAEGGKDACQGDSGGPLVYNDGTWKQIGIVSWGAGCASAGNPGVYTRLAVYKNWINTFLTGIIADEQVTFKQVLIDMPQTKTLSISNNAQIEAQLLFSLTGSGTFSFDREICATIASETTCSLEITYSPVEASITQATLSIESNLPNSITTTTLLTGSARDPNSTEAPPSIVPSSSGGGGGTLLFLLSIPLLLMRRYC
ncbi:trypsin-like serine protease [Psychromonas hadalis]|uniref:trypsin-like serine protease n=1 Tax=Psychromonas hadalis TaxID=211669 RepID=UPI0003B633BD|nr:trypsin-like serine protease [Psychromonas hadalis]